MNMSEGDAADIILKLIKGSLWSTPPVSDQPVIILARWRVVEVLTKNMAIERHFIGYNVEDGEGRASTAVEQFDPATGQAKTKSGRIYQLTGEPGYDSDGEWVWQNWARLNHFSDEKDVTAEFWKLMAGIKLGE